MENVKDIVDLAVATVTKENIPSEFTAADLENSLREQLSAFQDYKYLRKHAADLYEIIEEVANIVIPRKVLEQFGGFAEIRRKGYGEKILSIGGDGDEGIIDIDVSSAKINFDKLK